MGITPLPPNPLPGHSSRGMCWESPQETESYTQEHSFLCSPTLQLPTAFCGHRLWPSWPHRLGSKPGGWAGLGSRNVESAGQKHSLFPVQVPGACGQEPGIKGWRKGRKRLEFVGSR